MAGVAGRSGRKPKPTARKEAAGNPGKRALNRAEPDFNIVVNIDPPEWIIGCARDMWLRIMPLLCREKVLQETDIHNVEIFCTAYGNWRLAQVDVATNGIVVAGAAGGPVKNPALTAINETAKQMATFGALLGLDPSSRSRVMGGRKSDNANPFGKLIGAK
jgi:P27 family predicted phage terminase small subunit